MPQSRNQAYIFQRYLWLYETIALHQPVSFSQISDLWQVSRHGDGTPLPHKTFENHRKAVADLFDIDIICDRATNLYSIAKGSTSLSREAINLLNNALTLHSVATVRDSARFVFTESVFNSSEYISIAISALNALQSLSLTYRHNYDDASIENITVKPIGLKMFKQRWYLVAENPDGAPYSYAFDRIVALSLGGKISPSEIDLQTLFSDSYGIIREKGVKAEDIILKVELEQANYFKHLPLHSSQEIIGEDSNYCYIKLHLCPTCDFIMEILSHGSKIKVISPDSVRDRIAEIIRKQYQTYAQ